MSCFGDTVYAAELVFHEVLVTGGNGNGGLEPGEVAGLIVSLDNNGSAAAESLNTTLRSLSSLVTVLDSAGFYPIIEPGGTAANDADTFVIAADSSISPGTVVNFRLILDATYCNDTLPFQFLIGTGIETANDALPICDALNIYPNPCNGSLNIRMNSSSFPGENTSIHIYNTAGLLVREYLITGNNGHIVWNGDDHNGHQLPGGVYFITSTADTPDKTYKIIFLK